MQKLLLLCALALAGCRTATEVPNVASAVVIDSLTPNPIPIFQTGFADVTVWGHGFAADSNQVQIDLGFYGIAHVAKVASPTGTSLTFRLLRAMPTLPNNQLQVVFGDDGHRVRIKTATDSSQWVAIRVK